MIVVNNIGKTDDYVYDISLDGTVVNALGLNVLSNTDGFNFQKPLKYRYTESHPYIGKGLGRNVKKEKNTLKLMLMLQNLKILLLMKHIMGEC